MRDSRVREGVLEVEGVDSLYIVRIILFSKKCIESEMNQWPSTIENSIKALHRRVLDGRYHVNELSKLQHSVFETITSGKKLTHPDTNNSSSPGTLESAI